MPSPDKVSRGATNSGPPAALVALDAVLARHRDQAVSVPFDAVLAGQRVTVTAVLDRTAVYGPAGDRELARHERFMVAESGLAWRSISTAQVAARRRGLVLSRFSTRRRKAS